MYSMYLPVHIAGWAHPERKNPVPYCAQISILFTNTYKYPEKTTHGCVFATFAPITPQHIHRPIAARPTLLSQAGVI